MNTQSNKTLLLIACMLFLQNSIVFGENSFLLPTTQDAIIIPTEYVHGYEDKTNQLTFEQISHTDFQERFIPIQENVAFKSPSENARWITFSLNGSALLNKKWILEIPTNTVPYIDVFIVDSSGKISSFQVGNSRPMGNKMIPHKNFLFDLPLAQEKIQVYAKYKVAANAPFFFWLKTNNYMLSYSNKEYILLGIFYGILFIMGVYNLLLYLITRERISLFFTLYVFSSIILTTVTDGLGFQYLWPNSPYINVILSKIAPHFYIGSLLFYVAAFLNLPRRQKKLFTAILIFSICILLFNLWKEEINWAVNIVSYLLPIILIFIANIRSVKEGFKPARLLLLGQTFTLTSIGIIFLRKYGMIDYTVLNEFQIVLIVYALNIALVVEVILFSLAQANKINYKQVEKERKIVASEERFRNIFESCFDAILVYDTKTRHIIDANESAVLLFQKNKAQLERTSIEDIIDFKQVISEKNGIYPLSRQFLENQSKFEFETTGLKTNGDQIGCEVSLSIMEKETQELVVITINDSSERREAERALNAKMLEITQKNEELRRYISSNSELESFAYVVSHDMKQPLRTISSFSNLLHKRLQKQNLLDEESATYLDFINGGIENIQALINDLLEHSKITASGNLQFETHNLNKLLQTVQLNLNSQISENNVQLSISHLPEELAISKVKINQLFQNLISNAIKFRKSNQACKVLISAIEKSSFWLFQIQDNGIGIAKKNHDQIFQLFKKLHTQKEYKGSGVGLSTCKKIIELHGGSIWVHSEEGIGTTFFFTIQKNLNNSMILTAKMTEVN